MFDKTIIFVDGENLVFRYQEMLKAGRIARPGNIHIKDCFIWNHKVFEGYYWNLKRLCYYTSVVGDDDFVRGVRQKISEVTWKCEIGSEEAGVQWVTGQIMPFVRKRANKTKKESICDISIAVDIMRACYRDHAETVWLFSGDGDFAQLIEEATHAGKMVYLSALSSGFNEELKYVVDEFHPLDDVFFLTDQEVQDAAAAAVKATAPAKRKAKPLTSGK